MIKSVGGGKYVVYDHTGRKHLSKPMSKASAQKRLREIEYFKAKGKK